MSTWEERMAAKAAGRREAAEAAERERLEAEWAREQAELEERYRSVREAGPPGGCRECWSWCLNPPYFLGWLHGACVQPGPPPADLEPDSMLQDSEPEWWCWHSCHADPPVSCVPVAYGRAAHSASR